MICNIDTLPEELMKIDNELARWMWTSATSFQLLNQPTQKQFNHFIKVLGGVNVAEFLSEIKPEHWHENVSRARIKAQQYTDAIAFRTNPPIPEVKREHNQITVDTPFASQYPKLMAFLQNFAGMQKGELSRAMVVRLAPKQQVSQHFDWGYYYLVRDRYHIVLQSTGSQMKSGGEACTWNVGELWWFNNKLLHEAYNPGDTWRVHVIFDILPAHMKPWAARLDTMVRKQVNTIENDIHVPHL